MLRDIIFFVYMIAGEPYDKETITYGSEGTLVKTS